MRRLGKLTKITNYLYNFSLPEHEGLNIVLVVDQDNATSQLTKASGDQLLIALPEGRFSGYDVDQSQENVNVAFFALSKINSPAKTKQLMQATYQRLLSLISDVLERMTEDITGEKAGMPCPLLAGINIISAEIIPEYSLFGGWSGYYLEMGLA